MKKLLALLLAGTMVLTLAACKPEEDISAGNRNTDPTSETPTDESTKPTENTDTAPTENVPTAPTEDNGPVWDKIGDGSVAVFYGKESSEIKSALDAEWNASNIKFTNFDDDDLDDIQEAINQGVSLLLVSLSDTSEAQAIVDLASAAKIPLVFFNCSVPENVVTSYNRCALLETDETQIGRSQGRLVGDFVSYNFDVLDLNKDGKISYVMLADDGSDVEAASCTRYSVAAANEILAQDGHPSLSFYDPSNTNNAVAAPSGGWSTAAGTQTTKDILAKYTEASNNMVELILVNNEDAAIGVVDALQAAGYNTMGNWYVPVFGVGDSDEIVEILQSGAMSGTVMWDASNMAKAVCQMTKNLYAGTYVFEGLDAEVDGTWRANVAYGTFTGE